MTNWADKTSGINIGDQVAYKASFLRSTGMYTGSIPHARGVVTEITRFGGSIDVATIQWDTDEAPGRVAIKNLSKVSARGLADE